MWYSGSQLCYNELSYKEIPDITKFSSVPGREAWKNSYQKPAYKEKNKDPLCNLGENL